MPSEPGRWSRRLLAAAAWLVLIGIALATLVPLDMRPESGLPTDVERFLAFALMALLFALAYPRRVLLLLVLVLAFAVGLEVLQNIAVHRHARINDAEIKLAGGLVGLAAGWLAMRFFWPSELRGK